MAVTFATPRVTALGGWVALWTSDLDDPTYRVYVNGVYQATTKANTWTLAVQETESITIEVFDDEVTRPQIAVRAPVVMTWQSVAGTSKYRVEQLIDSVWTIVKEVKSDDPNLRYVSPPLADSVTEHELRVTSVGTNENESSPVAVSVINRRHPDPPEDTTFAYDPGDNTVTISAA